MSAETGVRPRRNEPLAGYTSMRVGGPADLLAVARDAPAFMALVGFARARGLRFLVLGRGSNVVVADAGIRALVILSRAEGWRIDGDRLIAEAGLPLARAATLCQRLGLSGLEFGLAIPGTVGGAVWANAGAHGADVAGVLESVTVLRADGTVATVPASALSLSYRDSRLKQGEGSATGALVTAGDTAPVAATAPTPATIGDLVLTATFKLIYADPAAIKVRLDEIRRWRREHQPLNQPSAGSVFRNPPGDSAGRLIDACGLRGARLGDASISEKHANFIVNMGTATAADVRSLAERARAAVAERFGVDLVYEVQFVGDWSGPKQKPSAARGRAHPRPGSE
jgi:UDP-N-acetylmuramate dehydrogenase